MTRTGRALKKKDLVTMAHIALLASDRFEGFFRFKQMSSWFLIFCRWALILETEQSIAIIMQQLLQSFSKASKHSGGVGSIQAYSFNKKKRPLGFRVLVVLVVALELEVAIVPVPVLVLVVLYL